jgi:hypothetical protein
MIAVIRDPHCTGALTPSGAAPQVAGATAAAAGDELVLGHLRRHRQQIEHLPPLHPDVGCGCQVRAAARARTGLVPLPLVRVSDQRSATSANLEPGFPRCPPGRRPLSPRSDFGVGLTNGESDDGGFEEFRELMPRRRHNSAFSVRGFSVSARN